MPKGKASPKTYLVEVAAITKAPSQPTLSYFSSIKLPRGTLGRVPLRAKSVPALVLRSRSVISTKSDIRRAGFLLKKIKKSDVLDIKVPLETLEHLEETAHYYGTALGV